jgi:hypothetical protein
MGPATEGRSDASPSSTSETSRAVEGLSTPPCCLGAPSCNINIPYRSCPASPDLVQLVSTILGRKFLPTCSRASSADKSLVLCHGWPVPSRSVHDCPLLDHLTAHHNGGTQDPTAMPSPSPIWARQTSGRCTVLRQCLSHHSPRSPAPISHAWHSQEKDRVANPSLQSTPSCRCCRPNPCREAAARNSARFCQQPTSSHDRSAFTAAGRLLFLV